MQTYDCYVNAVPTYNGFEKNLLKQMVGEVQTTIGNSSKIVLLGFNDHPDFVNTRQYCFIHYDLGFDASRLKLCLDCLQPGGILLLDNYGLITANPCLFEHWFAQRGHRVAAAPHSEQGWVIKHA